MAPIKIRELQKISGEAIAALPGPTPIKSGSRTVGVLYPIRRADPERLRAILEKAEALAKERDAAADNALLAEVGADPTDWSFAATEAFKADLKRTS